MTDPRADADALARAVHETTTVRSETAKGCSVVTACMIVVIALSPSPCKCVGFGRPGHGRESLHQWGRSI